MGMIVDLSEVATKRINTGYKCKTLLSVLVHLIYSCIAFITTNNKNKTVITVSMRDGTQQQQQLQGACVCEYAPRCP